MPNGKLLAEMVARVVERTGHGPDVAVAVLAAALDGVTVLPHIGSSSDHHA